MMMATIHAGASSSLDERNQRARDEQLVGERIDELAEGRDLFPAPGQIPVQPVGDGCEAENRGADELVRDAENLAALELRQQHDHEQGHEEDAAERQRVREVHDTVRTNDIIEGCE